jgi:murein DD-endopeptidase MepM/ murein hydrolase activator NlpD
MDLSPKLSQSTDWFKSRMQGRRHTVSKMLKLGHCLWNKAKYMNKNKFTIILLSPGNGPSRQFRVSLFGRLFFKAALGMIAAATVVLVCQSFYLHHYIQAHRDAYAEADRLEGELQTKNAEIASLTHQNSNATIANIPEIQAFEDQALSVLKIQLARKNMPSRGSSDLSEQGLTQITAQNDLSLDDHAKLLQQLYDATVENQAQLAHIPSFLPLSTRISSPFGYRRNPFGGWASEFHDGVDLVCNIGTPVPVTADGIVTYAGWDYTYGRKVEVDHGNGIVTFYGHNSRLAVNVGDHVKKGDIISYSGNTGRSSGPHLHYGVHVNGEPVDPLTFNSPPQQ